MATLFDQYEQASTHRATPQRQRVHEPVSTGFINARIEDDHPIFNKQRINFSPKDKVSHLVVSNNCLVMGMSSNMLTRIDLEHAKNQEEIEIPKSVDDCINKIFLDPTGRHLIISMKSGENYYLSKNSKKPRPLSKLKGNKISAVGWNKESTTDTSTGEILLGTEKGLIFELEIQAADDNRFFQGSLEQYNKQLFNLGREKSYPVTGIEIEKIPNQALSQEYKYFILVTLPGRLYQFLGTVPSSTEPPMFHHVFSNYDDVPEGFLELPGNFGYSELKLYHPRYKAVPSRFSWMAGPGVYYGDIDVTVSETQNSVTTNSKLMQYPREDGERPLTPIAMVLTQFHVLVLFPDRLKAICLLNEQLVYDDVFSDRFGQLIGMGRDDLKGTIWVYTSSAVFKYKVIKEARDVWQMYLDMEKFDQAKEYSRDNPANLDKVLTRQAEFFFGKQRYMKSAEIYADTRASFEEIALKFIQLDDKTPLKAFLQRKLAALSIQDRTQTTMLVVWLIEIYLNQLGLLREQGKEGTEADEVLQDEFRRFLAQPNIKECVALNTSLVYDLISSHGDVQNMIFFAVIMQDFDKVIGYYIQHEHYKKALDMLNEQQELDLFYKFSPVLMQNLPADTVQAWISKGRRLDPKQLIPALVQYDNRQHQDQGNEAIRYLEYCVRQLHVQDQAIHNYLVSLYAKLKPEDLMMYLHLQGQDPETVPYDLKYALRLCSEHNHKKACVHIYSIMGLYEEAVDLALQVDVELAKQNADRPDDDQDLRKKLWLRIARHVVEEERDVKRAMEFLHECDLLKIEDILPFFPEFVTIDHFKDAIVESLQQYNQHIDTLKDEMEEATTSAKDIRGEIQSFRNKFAFVKAQDKCHDCGFPLMTRGFYIFPCSHKFHHDCLFNLVLPLLRDSQKSKAQELKRRLESHDQGMLTGQNSTNSMGTSRQSHHSIKEELDDMIAGECVLCGDFMIRNTDAPFVDGTDSLHLQSWS